MKRIARACVCWQPKGVYTRTIKKKRKDAASASNSRTIRVAGRNNGCKNVLDRVALQEAQMQAGEVRVKQARAFRETGRLKKVRELAKASKWAGNRLHVSLSAEKAFELMYKGQMPKIYNEGGALNDAYSSSEFDLVS